MRIFDSVLDFLYAMLMWGLFMLIGVGLIIISPVLLIGKIVEEIKEKAEEKKKIK